MKKINLRCGARYARKFFASLSALCVAVSSCVIISGGNYAYASYSKKLFPNDCQEKGDLPAFLSWRKVESYAEDYYEAQNEMYFTNLSKNLAAGFLEKTQSILNKNTDLFEINSTVQTSINAAISALENYDSGAEYVGIRSDLSKDDQKKAEDIQKRITDIQSALAKKEEESSDISKVLEKLKKQFALNKELLFLCKNNVDLMAIKKENVDALLTIKSSINSSQKSQAEELKQQIGILLAKYYIANLNAKTTTIFKMPCTMNIPIEVETPRAILSFKWKANNSSILGYLVSREDGTIEKEGFHNMEYTENYDDVKLNLKKGNYNLQFISLDLVSPGINNVYCSGGLAPLDENFCRVKDIELLSLAEINEIPKQYFATCEDLKNSECFNLKNGDETCHGRIVFGRRPEKQKYFSNLGIDNTVLVLSMFNSGADSFFESGSLNFMGQTLDKVGEFGDGGIFLRSETGKDINWQIAGYDNLCENPGIILWSEEPILGCDKLMEPNKDDLSSLFCKEIREDIYETSAITDVLEVLKGEFVWKKKTQLENLRKILNSENDTEKEAAFEALLNTSGSDEDITESEIAEINQLIKDNYNTFVEFLLKDPQLRILVSIAEGKDELGEEFGSCEILRKFLLSEMYPSSDLRYTLKSIAENQSWFKRFEQSKMLSSKIAIIGDEKIDAWHAVNLPVKYISEDILYPARLKDGERIAYANMSKQNITLGTEDNLYINQINWKGLFWTRSRYTDTTTYSIVDKRKNAYGTCEYQTLLPYDVAESNQLAISAAFKLSTEGLLFASAAIDSSQSGSEFTEIDINAPMYLRYKDGSINKPNLICNNINYLAEKNQRLVIIATDENGVVKKFIKKGTGAEESISLAELKGFENGSKIHAQVWIESDIENANASIFNSCEPVSFHFISGEGLQKKGTTYSSINHNHDINWLKEESDGTSAWYGISDPNGVLEEGSTFHVQWFNSARIDEEERTRYNEIYEKLDDEYKAYANSGKLWIFDMGVTKPNGEEYHQLDGEVYVYVELGEDWSTEELAVIYVTDYKDEKVEYELLSYPFEISQDAEKTELESVAKLKINHFSPYAILEKDGDLGFDKSQSNFPKTEDALNFVPGMVLITIILFSVAIRFKFKI